MKQDAVVEMFSPESEHARRESLAGLSVSGPQMVQFVGGGGTLKGGAYYTS